MREAFEAKALAEKALKEVRELREELKEVLLNKKKNEPEKQRLFTTHDGVDIYLGDRYFLLTCRNRLLPNKAHLRSGRQKLLYFSTKEAGEKYLSSKLELVKISDVEAALVKFAPFSNTNQILQYLIDSKK